MKIERKATPQEKAILIKLPEAQARLSSTRYYIFTLIFLTNTLYYTLVNFPQGIQTALLLPPYSFSSFEYGVFFGISSLPNVILPLFVGISTDKNGYSSLLVISLGLCAFVGMIFITIGTYKTSLTIMILGRLIMGVGIENIDMIIKKILLQINTKEESVAAWGIFLASNRIGSMLASGAPALIYSATNSVTICFFVGILISVAFCIFFFFGMILMKKNMQNKSEIISPDVGLSTFSLLRIFSKEIEGVFWMLTILACLNFCMFNGFFSEANNFLTKEANLDSLDASYFLIVFSVFGALFQPLMGIILSKTGYTIFALIIGSFIDIAAFIIFIELYGTDDSALVLIPILLLAFGYSACTTFIYSAFGLIVSPKNFGLAYGIFQNCINFGILIGPLLFGYIKDSTAEYQEGYFWAIVETMGLQGIISFLAFVILIMDFLTTRKLCIKS